MTEMTANKPNTTPMPADRNANWGLVLGFGSMAAFWLSQWLINFFGMWAFNVGVVVWLLLWIGSLMLAATTLRNAHSSAQAKLLRRKAIGGLILDAVSLAMVVLFFYILIRAIQQFQ